MTPHAAGKTAPSLWFFVSQFDNSDNSAQRYTIPCGFWSSEKYPTSVPADIVVNPTAPQFEFIRAGAEAPLFTSRQILEDLVFTTQTKYASLSIWNLFVGYRANTAYHIRMVTEILELTEDELSAFRAFQDSLLSPTEDDTSDLGDARTDIFATYDNRDDNNIGRSDTGSLKLETNASNNAWSQNFRVCEFGLSGHDGRRGV